MNKDVFLALFVAAVVVAVVCLLLRTIWRSALDTSADKTRVQMQGLLESRTDFVPSHTSYSKTSKSLLSVDDASMKVTQYFVQGSQIMVRTAPVASILDLQLLVDEQASVTGVGSAIGTDSSILGVGKAFVHTDVRAISLRFLLNDTQTPVFVHECLSSAAHGKFESASGYVRDALNEAVRMKTVLDVLIHRAQVAA
jgi:hypothetical protein